MNGQEREIAQELLYNSLLEGKEATLRSKGLSMEPLFGSGDEITFVKRENFKFGDLIVYRQNSDLVVHRFIRKIRKDNKQLLLLKADAFWKMDTPIEPNTVAGVAIKIKSNGRVIHLDTYSGQLKSLFFLLISYINLIFKTRFFNSKKDNFKKERQIIKFLFLDTLSENQIFSLKEILDDNLNWEYLQEQIKWNFLAPFFIKKINKLGLKQLIPEKKWRMIDNVRLCELKTDTRNRAVLGDVLEEFNARGIEVIVTKGAQLGVEVYEDTYLRWMGDIDLIVKPIDWHKAYTILQDLGFSAYGTNCNYNSWALEHLDTHIDFFKEETRIELKSGVWAIEFPCFDYNLWQGARIIKSSNDKISYPSYEDTLLISCVNLARHNFSGLIWFLDIKKIVDTIGFKIDWQTFISITQKDDLNSVAYQALSLTNDLLGVAVPVEVLEKLYPGSLRIKLFNLLWDRRAILMEKDGSSYRVKLPFECALVLFGGKFNFKLEKFLQYIKFFLRIIFPPARYLSVRYKIRLGSVSLLKCYLLRMQKFISTVSLSILKVMFRIVENK